MPKLQPAVYQVQVAKVALVNRPKFFCDTLKRFPEAAHYTLVRRFRVPVPPQPESLFTFMQLNLSHAGQDAGVPLDWAQERFSLTHFEVKLMASPDDTSAIPINSPAQSSISRSRRLPELAGGGYRALLQAYAKHFGKQTESKPT